MPRLDVSHLSKRFGRILAVDNISFSLAPGEIVGYLGPNGAGKSTTVKMLVGLLEPSDGRILLDGRSVLEDPAGYQHRLGYLPEESNLYPYLSGREYLQLAGRLRGIARSALEPRIAKLLRLFELHDDAHAPVSSYSKGMRQKILLAGAILHDPEILILDEPLSGLDVHTILVVRELLKALAARGRIIFYSSHILDIVERICSRVLIVQEGRILADDTIGHLRERMSESSLEAVFARLTHESRHEEIAAGILEAIR